MASVNKACDAVAVDKTGAAEKVLAPAIVWAVVKSTKFCVLLPVPPFATGKTPVILAADTVAIFASVTLASNIFAVVILPSAIFAVVTLASKILLVVTALFAIVNAVEPVTSPVWVALDINPLYKLFTALSPVFVPDKLATAPLDNIALLIAPLAIEVALPILVTTPVKLALVVTVAAFPPIFKPAAVPVILVPTNAEGVPNAGVTSVGEVLITTFPDPVIAFEIIFLLASVNNA